MNINKPDEQFLKEYLSVAPIPLALIRAIDCRHISEIEFTEPILDVGCGDGLFAKILFRGAPDRIDTGIDLNEGELEKAKKTGVYKKVINCSVTHTPLPNNYYETVLSNSALEHVPELDAAISEISRVLKPEGKLIFTVPSQYLAEHFFFPAILKKIGLKALARLYIDLKNRAWKHYYLHPPQIWTDNLRKHKLKVVEFKYIHPEKITRLCDLFILTGAISLIWRKLFKRLLLFPNSWRGKFLSGLLKRYYHLDSETGSTILMIAKKTK